MFLRPVGSKRLLRRRAIMSFLCSYVLMSKKHVNMLLCLLHVLLSLNMFVC